MIIEITERCRCGSFLSLFEENSRWVCSCLQRCYDPSVEDPSPIEALYGQGETPADAVADYLRLREDADLEPVYVPTDLASFVVPSHPGSLRVLTERLDTLAEAESFAEAFTSSGNEPGRRVVWPPSPIFFEPANPLTHKAANQ